MTQRGYIAGPMTGCVDHNLAAFFATADTVRALGYLAENPGDNDGATAKAAVGNSSTSMRTWSDYLRIDIARLTKCDFVVVLPGWQQSRGANLEVDIAQRLGMPITCLARAWPKNGAHHDDCDTWQIVPRVRAIGLSGYARAGKDTVGKILVKQHGYVRASFADKLKDLALRVNPIADCAGYPLSHYVGEAGWEDAKDRLPEVRRLLQAIGTGVRDIVGPNTWVDLAMRDIPDGSKVVFTDARFPSEAEAITAASGALWRVTRPGHVPVNGHISETALDDWPFDRGIANNGTIGDLEHIVNMAMIA